ncbi:MAG: transcriptional repressor [Lachnospiraceae bacterium]|nr:transcriptional repressor [Lachnospiraceae bacterium]
MSYKHSKQREVIQSFLTGRKDHPTADTIYAGVREVIPNISLGTVYRNLQLLVDLGEIQKINVGDGVDHFDADVSMHHHFHCRICGCVSDVRIKALPFDLKDQLIDFDGEVETQTLYFEGVCSACKALKQSV